MPNKSRFMARLSLKNRLLWAAFLWLTVLVVAAGIGIPTLVQDYLENNEKSQLRLTMDEIVAHLITDEQGKFTLLHQLSDPRFNQPNSGAYWQIKSQQQTLRSRSLSGMTIQTDNQQFFTYSLGVKTERLIYIKKVVLLPDDPIPVHIVIGLEEDPLEETLHLLTGQLWFILMLLYIGVLVIISVQVSWSLRPLQKMQQELQYLKEGNIDQLSDDYPNEISPLIVDLNALLFHYQELLQRARHHVGNLSHALKTPLSILKNEIDTIENGKDTKLNDLVNQMQNHIDYHLGRARVAGSMNILSVKAIPSERIDAISMAFDKIYSAKKVLLVNELSSELIVSVDQTDLDEMLGNLLENSYKWAHSLIRIHSENISNNRVEIVIEDDGSGIPEESRHLVLQRGVRLDETTPGSGLGLNIVNEMAHSYRGSLTLSRSSMGGLKATLHLQRV
jgi:signal transduction histidine kinase